MECHYNIAYNLGQYKGCSAAVAGVAIYLRFHL